MIWFPPTFLGENITWLAVDSNSVDVQLVDDGRPTNFTAMQYREAKGDFSLDAWSTPITGYGDHAGLNLPTHSQAVWNLPSGDFTYAEMKLEEVKYNKAS